MPRTVGTAALSIKLVTNFDVTQPPQAIGCPCSRGKQGTNLACISPSIVRAHVLCCIYIYGSAANAILVPPEILILSSRSSRAQPLFGRSKRSRVGARRHGERGAEAGGRVPPDAQLLHVPHRRRGRGLGHQLCHQQRLLHRFRAGAAVTLLPDLLSDRERGDRVLRHLRGDRQRGRHGGGACRIPPCPGVEPREPAGGSLLWVHRLDAHTGCHGIGS